MSTADTTARPAAITADIFGEFDESDYRPDFASAVAAEIMGLKWTHAPATGEDGGDGEQMHRFGDVQEAVCRVLEAARVKTHSVYLGKADATPPASDRAVQERAELIEARLNQLEHWAWGKTPPERLAPLSAWREAVSAARGTEPNI